MEYVENLPAPQHKRTLVASIVALAIGAAAASGIWALADDDSGTATATGNGTSTPSAVTDDPGTQYGTAQYRLPDAQPTPHAAESRAPYGAKYRYPHP